MHTIRLLKHFHFCSATCSKVSQEDHFIIVYNPKVVTTVALLSSPQHKKYWIKIILNEKKSRKNCWLYHDLIKRDLTLVGQTRNLEKISFLFFWWKKMTLNIECSFIYIVAFYSCRCGISEASLTNLTCSSWKFVIEFGCNNYF